MTCVQTRTRQWTGSGQGQGSRGLLHDMGRHQTRINYTSTWCMVRKGVLEWSISTLLSWDSFVYFSFDRKLKFNTRFPSLFAIEAWTYKHREIKNVWGEKKSLRIELIQSIAGRPLDAHVFMHITKSLIKSTSNCRHRNQSQLPHRHRNPWPIQIRNRVRSPRWSVEYKNCQYVKVNIRIKGMRQKVMDSDPGPGECGALFINLR